MAAVRVAEAVLVRADSAVGDTSGKRYTLTAGIFFHNLFNTVNPGQIEGDLLSPRLGQPPGAGQHRRFRRQRGGPGVQSAHRLKLAIQLLTSTYSSC